MKSLTQFLQLLSITRRSQRVALLKHLTKQQCAHMRSLSHNLMFNSDISPTEGDRRYLNRHSSIIKHIASRRVCSQDKKDLLVENQSLVKRLADFGLLYLHSSGE